MRRSAQLDRSYHRTLWMSIVASLLVHGFILLSTRSAPGAAELVIDLSTLAAAAVPDRPMADPSLELIALRKQPPARPSAPEPPTRPPAEAPTAGPSAAAAAPGATAAESVPTHDSESRSATPGNTAPPVATFEPVPMAVLTLVGGDTIPALTDLEVAEVPNMNTTATGVPIYRRGSVMSAKDEWIAAAGGVDRRGGGVNVVFTAAGGVCPVRPNRGIFRIHTG